MACYNMIFIFQTFQLNFSPTDGQGDIFPCNMPRPCNESKLYGDPESCNHYYQCGSGGLLVHRKPCISGLLFDTTTSSCVWPHNNPVCEPPCPSTPAYTGTGTVRPSGTNSYST